MNVAKQIKYIKEWNKFITSLEFPEQPKTNTRYQILNKIIKINTLETTDTVIGYQQFNRDLE